MNLFFTVNHVSVDPEQNARNVSVTVEAIERTLSAHRGATHAVLCMVLIESPGKTDRFNVTAHSGGYDEAIWGMQSYAVEMQPNLPTWRKWVICKLLRIKRYKWL